MDLSIIIPIKDERDNLNELHDRLTKALAFTKKSYEILFVDDGSADDSFAVMQSLHEQDSCVKCVRLRRNFGQSAAMQAGIDHSKGDVIVTLDGDLQNDPGDIPSLLAKLDEGYDGVFGLRANRQDRMLLRKFPSAVANWLIRITTGTPFRDMGCTIRALRRDLALSLPLYGEMHRFVPVLAQQYGAKLTQIPVRHHPRTAGKTKYTLSRTVRVLLDLVTVKFLSSYMTRPMHFMGSAGLTSIGMGFLAGCATIWMKWYGNIDMTGNPLLLASVFMVLLGVQFLSIGLIAELQSRTYFESQGKKAYLVRETLNIPRRRRRRRKSKLHSVEEPPKKKTG